MGDMNFNPFDLQYAQLMQDGWQDSHSVTQNDNASTFLYTGTGAPSGRIDHIFYRGPHLSAQNWSRLQGQDITQRFSDHDPICVQFQIGQ
jgi:endonuclease/exonuclease/phosphatase (EEP) superfamily protein YafD